MFAISVFAGCGQRPLEPRDPDPGSVHFTVGTFNIRDDMSTDPRTVDAIGALGVDILAIQEVTPELEAILRERYKQKYPYMMFHSSDAAGIGFMSVFPVVEREFMQVTNGWHPALHASVQTPAGWLEVLEVHLHAPEGKYLAALQSIAETPQDHENEISLFTATCSKPPMLVLGDFNEDGAGRAVTWLENRGFVNALPLYHPGQYTLQGKSVGGQFQMALDHVMFGPQLIPLNAWIGPQGASDHIPVMVSFEAKQPW
ncbi:MAG: endonuclease/exonuclease/phosphatase family protein [Polyangiales bacterium]